MDLVPFLHFIIILTDFQVQKSVLCFKVVKKLFLLCVFWFIILSDTKNTQRTEKMEKKIKAVIFDLDGTLLDTLTDLAASVNATMREFDMPEHSREDVCRFVGNGVAKLIELALPDGKENPSYNEALEFFKSHYAEHMYDSTAPYNGITEALDILKQEGYRLAVVSNKFDAAVKELCHRYFPEHIEIAIGENEAAGIKKKPAPDTVIEALGQLGLSKDDAVYVGDSDVDVHTAKNSGMPCISVLWGFRDRDYLIREGASIFAENTQELIELIRE